MRFLSFSSKFPFFSFSKLYLLLESREGRKGEKHPSVSPPGPTRDKTRNPGLCPDQEATPNQLGHTGPA